MVKHLTLSLKHRDRSKHIVGMHGQPAICMHAKLSLTTAYAKLGRSYTDQKSCLFMSIKLSKLMLNPLCNNPCWVIFAPCSRHALSICLLRSQCSEVMRSKNFWLS